METTQKPRMNCRKPPFLPVNWHPKLRPIVEEALTTFMNAPLELVSAIGGRKAEKKVLRLEPAVRNTRLSRASRCRGSRVPRSAGSPVFGGWQMLDARHVRRKLHLLLLKLLGVQKPSAGPPRPLHRVLVPRLVKIWLKSDEHSSSMFLRFYNIIDGFKQVQTLRIFGVLFWDSSFARCSLLRRMAWYCLALTYMGSSPAG